MSCSVYLFNPGEVFAETYRLMNERKAGIPETPWRVVDESLQPNDHDLTLVEQDVMQPWSANHTVTIAGRFAARGSSVRSFNVATPLDGAFTASVQGSPVLRLDVFSGKEAPRAGDEVNGGDRLRAADAHFSGDADGGERRIQAGRVAAVTS